MAATKLNVSVNAQPVYVTPTGIRIGSKGRVLNAGVAFGQFGKGTARRVRKALFAERKYAMASAKAERVGV